MQNQNNNDNSKELEKFQKKNETSAEPSKGPFNFLIGSVTSFVFSYCLYWLSQKITIYFYSHKPSNTSEIVLNISSSINTLIIGLSFLATFSFAFIGLGLFIVFIRSFFEKNK